MRPPGRGGEVPLQYKERNGRLIVQPTILDAGTGTYELVIDEAAAGKPIGTAKHRLVCARPKF